jgi:hypothetical protein
VILVNDTDPDQGFSDEDIKALLNTDAEPQNTHYEKHRSAAIARAKSNVAQRDTILFAFIKVWTTIAEMLAPIFAAFSSKSAHQQAYTQANKKHKK